MFICTSLNVTVPISREGNDGAFLDRGALLDVFWQHLFSAARKCSSSGSSFCLNYRLHQPRRTTGMPSCRANFSYQGVGPPAQPLLTTPMMVSAGPQRPPAGLTTCQHIATGMQTCRHVYVAKTVGSTAMEFKADLKVSSMVWRAGSLGRPPTTRNLRRRMRSYSLASSKMGKFLLALTIRAISMSRLSLRPVVRATSESGLLISFETFLSSFAARAERLAWS